MEREISLRDRAAIAFHWAKMGCIAGCADMWAWKWIVVLVIVEIVRLKVELRHLEVERAILHTSRDIQQIIIDFMDAVAPGPRVDCDSSQHPIPS
jgi:hypothetical protein